MDVLLGLKIDVFICYSLLSASLQNVVSTINAVLHRHTLSACQLFLAPSAGGVGSQSDS